MISTFTTKKVLRTQKPFNYKNTITEEQWYRSQEFIQHTGNDEIDTFNIRHLENVRKAVEANYSNDEISMMLSQAWLYNFQVSFNIQSLQHLGVLRLGKEAHIDIRQMTEKMYFKIPKEMKYLFEDIVVTNSNSESFKKGFKKSMITSV